MDTTSSESCTIEFHVIVKSYNGTIGLGNTLEVEFRSECKLLDRIYDVGLWTWGSGDVDKVKGGYAVRDSAMTIDLPLI